MFVVFYLLPFSCGVEKPAVDCVRKNGRVWKSPLHDEGNIARIRAATLGLDLVTQSTFPLSLTTLSPFTDNPCTPAILSCVGRPHLLEVLGQWIQELSESFSSCRQISGETCRSAYCAKLPAYQHHASVISSKRRLGPPPLSICGN